ncbi:MAG: SHOCT domain-containing protein [Solirubrobacteraceae bacterium]
MCTREVKRLGPGCAISTSDPHARAGPARSNAWKRLESQPAAPAAAPATAAPAEGIGDPAIQRLQELGKLHEQGILTDEEFAQQKQKILAG